MRFIALAGCCIWLGGCGVARHVEASNNYHQSEATYRSCVMANPAAPQNCEGYRLAMEADERRYTNIGASLGGMQTSHNVTILNR